MIIDCISDLHGHYPQLEGGDLLIIAGDLTENDRPEEYITFYKWLAWQDYKRYIVIAGNHDNFLERESGSTPPFLLNVTYLCDSGTEFEGLKIWGSPWTKTFEGMNPRCKAFTCDTEEELAEKWKLIPDDTDILITHSPPWGHFDESYGSTSLITWISRHVYALKLHVFGHIHEQHGVWDIRKLQKEVGDPTTPIFVNASYVNEYYEPVNPPIRIIL